MSDYARQEEFHPDRYRNSDVMLTIAKSGSYPKRFSFHLFSDITKSNCGNAVVAPVMAFSAFGAIILGAKNESKSEILEAFYNNKQLSDEEESLIILQNRLMVLSAIDEKYTSAKCSTFLFLDENYAVAEAYQKRVEDALDLNLIKMDFNSATPVKFIKKCIKRVSRELVNDKLLDLRVDDDDNMILLECNFFCGDWKFPFAKTQIAEDFHNADATITSVNFLRSQGVYKFGYKEGFMCDVIEVPHQSSEMTMVVILPRKGHCLSKLTGNGVCNQLPNLLDTSKFEPRECELFIPQFQLETLTSMKSYLESFQIRSIFAKDKANFQILDNPAEEFALGQFLQLSTFRFINASHIEAGSEETRSIHSFKCNKPFAFVMLYKIGMKSFVFYEGILQNMH